MPRSATTAFDALDQQITQALADLRAARRDYEHSPNSDTVLTVEYAELRLNRLIDRRRTAGG